MYNNIKSVYTESNRYIPIPLPDTENVPLIKTTYNSTKSNKNSTKIYYDVPCINTYKRNPNKGPESKDPHPNDVTTYSGEINEKKGFQHLSTMTMVVNQTYIVKEEFK